MLTSWFCPRVKVHALPQVNGHSRCSDPPAQNCRKRQRPREDGSGEDGRSEEKEGKKRKKRGEKSLEGQASDEERKQTSEGKHIEKKKKKKKRKMEETVPKPAAPTTEPLTTIKPPVKSTSKPSAKPANTESSSSGSDSSSLPKHKTLTRSSPRTKVKSGSQEAPSPLRSTNCVQKRAAPRRHAAAEPLGSDSDGETEAANRPRPPQPGAVVGSQASGTKTWSGGPGETGRGRGGGASRGSEVSYHGATEPTYRSDSLTNVSVVLQVSLRLLFLTRLPDNRSPHRQRTTQNQNQL